MYCAIQTGGFDDVDAMIISKDILLAVVLVSLSYSSHYINQLNDELTYLLVAHT